MGISVHMIGGAKFADHPPLIVVAINTEPLNLFSDPPLCVLETTRRFGQ